MEVEEIYWIDEDGNLCVGLVPSVSVDHQGSEKVNLTKDEDEEESSGQVIVISMD